MVGGMFSQRVLIGGTARESGRNGPWSDPAWRSLPVASVFSEVLGKGLIFSLRFTAWIEIPIVQF